MKIHKDFIKSLLFEEESNTLEFKSQQYRFRKASDEDKSELLKDILAFSNAWRRTDAFILIGVREVKGGKNIVEGIAEHLDDANLQQFVNSKTQRPVNFSYSEIELNGLPIGLIHVPLQQRPIYLKKDFGRLTKGTVYIRRGSSTAKADPDEIAQMGSQELTPDTSVPQLELMFADSDSRTAVGTAVTVDSLILEVAKKKEIPDYDPEGSFGPGRSYIPTLRSINHDYYREITYYTKTLEAVTPIGFAIKNIGESVANDVRVEILIPDPDYKIMILDEYEIPERPVTEHLQRVIQHRFDSVAHDILVDRVGGNYLVQIKAEKVQPKATVWIKSQLYIGAIESCSIQFDAFLYADNIPEPITTQMEVNVNARHKKPQLEDILDLDQKRFIATPEGLELLERLAEKDE